MRDKYEAVIQVEAYYICPKCFTEQVCDKHDAGMLVECTSCGRHILIDEEE